MSYEIRIVGAPRTEGTATSDEIRATLLALFSLLEKRGHYLYTIEARTPIEGQPSASNVYSVNLPDANLHPMRPAARPSVYEREVALGPSGTAEKKTGK